MADSNILGPTIGDRRVGLAVALKVEVECPTRTFGAIPLKAAAVARRPQKSATRSAPEDAISDLASCKKRVNLSGSFFSEKLGFNGFRDFYFFK